VWGHCAVSEFQNTLVVLKCLRAVFKQTSKFSTTRTTGKLHDSSSTFIAEHKRPQISTIFT